MPEWNGRGPPVDDMKQRVEREKELREEVLEKRRALAHEVTQHTKILAGTPENLDCDDSFGGRGRYYQNGDKYQDDYDWKYRNESWESDEAQV